MTIHRTVDQIADELESEPNVIINALRDVDVPVFQGRVDSVLFAEALAAANHHLAPNAAKFIPDEG